MPTATPQQDGDPRREKKHGRTRGVRRFTLIQAIGSIVLLGLLALAVRHLPVVDSLVAVQGYVDGMGMVAPVVYPLIYALCNVLLLPAGILGMAGGFLFGLWQGFFIVLSGNVIGAAAAFLISRYIARGWIERRIARHARLRALDASIERDGWKVVVLSQLHPLFPTSLLNYLYGLTRMSFWQCILWVAIGQAPGLFLYAYLGTLGQFGIAMLQGNNRPGGWEYVFWLGGLALAFVVTFLLGRLALRMLADAQNATDETID